MLINGQTLILAERWSRFFQAERLRGISLFVPELCVCTYVRWCCLLLNKRHTNFQHQQSVNFQRRSSTPFARSHGLVTWLTGAARIRSLSVTNPKHVTYTLELHGTTLSDCAPCQLDFNLCEVPVVLSCCNTDPVTFC